MVARSNKRKSLESRVGPILLCGWKMAKKSHDVSKHILVPVHTKLNDKEKKELLEKYHVSLKELPKIRKKDPAIAHLNAKEGDIIKVIRNSPTAEEAVFYRGVVNV